MESISEESGKASEESKDSQILNFDNYFFKFSGLKNNLQNGKFKILKI